MRDRPADVPEFTVEQLRDRSISFSVAKRSLTIAEFERFVSLTKTLLDDVTRAAVGKPSVWVLTNLAYGSATLSAANKLEDEAGDAVNAAIVEGISRVEVGDGKPSFFSDRALSAASKLSRLASDDGVFVTAPHGLHASLTPAVEKNVRELLRPSSRRYFGSAVGNLDVVSVHRRPSATIYGGRGDVVKCLMSAELLERAVDLLGRTAIVSGKVTTNRLGDPLSIEAEDIFEAPTRSKTSPRKFRGRIPDITGGVSLRDFIADLRGDQSLWR